jgi:RecB family endonuclease NucS
LKSKAVGIVRFFRDTTELNLIHVQERFPLLRLNGKAMNIDIVAESSCGRVVLVEVKKRLQKSTPKMVEDFLEKVAMYQKQFPDRQILPAFFSATGFTKKAKELCDKRGVFRTDQMKTLSES